MENEYGYDLSDTTELVEYVNHINSCMHHDFDRDDVPENVLAEINSCTRMDTGLTVEHVQRYLATLPERKYWYILCTQQAVNDGAVYEHNKQIAVYGRVVVLRCNSEFLATYQRGRLHSAYWWAVGNDGPFTSIEAAKEHAQAAEDRYGCAICGSVLHTTNNHA